MSFLNRIFKQSNPDVKGVGKLFVTQWEDGRPAPLPTDFNALMAHNKKWVYKCASINATAVAGLGIRMYAAKRAGTKLLYPSRQTKSIAFHSRKAAHVMKNMNAGDEVVEITEHPLLTLLENPNPRVSGYDFLEMTTYRQELIGNAYWYVVKDGLGTPVMLWNLQAENVKIVPSRESMIAGYEVKVGSEKITFSPDEIIHHRYPTPSNSFYGMSPLAAVAGQAVLDEYMDKFDTDLFHNRAMPEVVLTTDQQMTSETAEGIKKTWRQRLGFMLGRMANEVMVLSNGLKPFQLTMKPTDLNHLEGKKVNRDTILSAFGVPVTKVDPSQIVNNTDAGEREYQRNTIRPRGTRLVNTLNATLVPMFDDNVWLDFDDPVTEDRALMLKEDVEYVKVGVYTADEIRARRGHDPLPDGLGETPLPLLTSVSAAPMQDAPKQ